MELVEHLRALLGPDMVTFSFEKARDIHYFMKKMGVICNGVPRLKTPFSKPGSIPSPH